MIRFVVFLALGCALAYCGATVKLGDRTFFEHVRAIWHTEEVKDLKEGVRETAGPAVKRVERGIEAGYKAIKDGDAGTSAAGSATPAPAPAPTKP